MVFTTIDYIPSLYLNYFLKMSKNVGKKKPKNPGTPSFNKKNPGTPSYIKKKPKKTRVPQVLSKKPRVLRVITKIFWD